MLGKGLCKVWLVMDYLLCSASVFNIVLISYDRFLSVTRAVSTRCGGAHHIHTHTRSSEVEKITIFRALQPCQALIYNYYLVNFSWVIGQQNIKRTSARELKFTHHEACSTLVRVLSSHPALD